VRLTWACIDFGRRSKCCALVYLAALNGRSRRRSRGLPWREPSSRHDEEVRHSGIEAAFDEIADQRLQSPRFRCTLHDAERMLVAFTSTPIAATGSCPRPCDAVDLDDHQPETGKIGRHPFLQPRCRQRNKTPRGGRFRQARALGAGTSPSGKRIERWNLRVETLISIWFTAHLPSQSSVIASSQSEEPAPCRQSREAGDVRSPLAAVEAEFAFVLPQRCAAGLAARMARPAGVRASASIISARASIPEARQNLSKLADMLASASIFNSLIGIAVDV